MCVCVCVCVVVAEGGDAISEIISYLRKYEVEDTVMCCCLLDHA